MKYKNLFTPVKIGSVVIKNRFAMAPMGPLGLADAQGGFNQRGIDYYTERAKGGTGLIITGVTFSDCKVETQSMPNCPNSTYNPVHFIRTAREMTERVHAYESKIFLMMSAGFGRVTIPTNLGEFPPVAPSAIPHRWLDKICRPLTVEEIHSIVKSFGDGAYNAKRAGFDGVEIHAVHEGYLLDQFAMKYTNHRSDRYGGSFENRYRFAVEIVKAIKAACGADYPVSIRYSVLSKVKDFCYGALPGETYTEIGRDMEESEKAARYLQDAGYDMLNADNGTYDSWYWAHPPMYMPLNCNLEDVAHIRKFVDIPVVCAGRMEPDAAAAAIAEGRIDAMGVARQFLADGAWVTKMLEDRMEDIRPCICCHNGCFNMAHYKGHANAQAFGDTRGMARCAINPPTMQSRKYRLTPAAAPKEIAVIGGGIGGMESALVCARRGHNVTLYEKSDRLGGVFQAAAAPSFKEKDRALLAWYAREVTKYPNLTVKLGTEVKDPAALHANEIVVATGATPVSLPVPGVEKGIQAVDYLLGRRPVGEKVVIVGGGLTGCEIAYDLYLQGKQPTIVEMKDDLIAVSGVCLANSSYLRDFFKTNQVPVYLETSLGEIRDGAVTVTRKDGARQELPADSVILSVGYRPAPLAAKGRHVHIVGDARKVGNLRTVIWRAWDVCMKL